MREDLMAGLIRRVAEKSEGFVRPPITAIGGYALRAFIPFSRYTRGCGFVLPKGEPWSVDRICDWFPGGPRRKTLEKRETFGFLRMVDFLTVGKKSARVAIDFMEGEVRGRTSEQIVSIDRKFVEKRTRVKMRIGRKDIEAFVPDYTDYFIMKVVSGRPSDVRDIAALVWNKGIPGNLDERMSEMLPFPSIFRTQLEESIIPDMSDTKFVNSWRGTFVTTAFDGDVKEDVLSKIRELLL
jgi:hypothetical protein